MNLKITGTCTYGYKSMSKADSSCYFNFTVSFKTVWLHNNPYSYKNNTFCLNYTVKVHVHVDAKLYMYMYIHRKFFKKTCLPMHFFNNRFSGEHRNSPVPAEWLSGIVGRMQ